jgi:hypothetical protein
VTQILQENVLERRGRRLLRSPGGRQDGHDRQSRRRVVLGLRSSARDDGLGRYPRRIPMENVHGISVAGGTPGHDLETVHGVGAPERAARLATAPDRRLAALHTGSVRPRPHRPRTTPSPTTTGTTTKTPARAHDSAAGPAPRDSGATASAAARRSTSAADESSSPASAGVAACGWRCAPQSSRSRCS